MTREQARQYSVAMLAKLHRRNNKQNRDRLIQRFLNGHPSCQKFLEEQHKALQKSLDDTTNAANTVTCSTPLRSRVQAPLFSPNDVLSLLKNPTLFTIVVTWFGLSFTAFTNALTILGLGDICPDKSTYYRKLDELQPVASILADESMDHALRSISVQTILGFDGGWNHPRNARQGHAVFIDLRTQNVVAMGMGWLLVGNETDKMAEKCAESCRQLQVYNGFPQSIESEIFKRLYPRFHNNEYIIGFAQDNEHDHGGVMKKMASRKKRFVDVNHNAKHFRNYLARAMEGNLSRLQHTLSAWMGFLLHTTSVPEGMKEQLWRNTTNHLLGNHEECIHGEDKCNEPLITEEEVEKLTPIITKGVEFLGRSHPLVTTQMNESLNSLRARLTPKNYSWKKAWPLRTNVAVLKWNDGDRALIEFCRRLRTPVADEVIEFVERLCERTESQEAKSKTEDARKKRNERRQSTADSLRKGRRKTADAQERTSVAEVSATDILRKPEEEDVSECEDEDLNLSSSTSVEYSESDSPIAKNLSNYAGDMVTEEELPFLVRDFVDARVDHDNFGYTGIVNKKQTCYFNSTLQLICVALRHEIRSGHVLLQDIVHKSRGWLETEFEYDAADQMESQILETWNSDAWGPGLMHFIHIMITGSMNVIEIDEIIQLMAESINNNDFSYMEQGDPVFLLEYLTRYFDQQLIPGYPHKLRGPFKFHFSILTYKDVVTPVTASKSMEPPIDEKLLIYISETHSESQIPLTFADWTYDIQGMINNEFVAVVEDGESGYVYLRRYMEERCQYLFLSINRHICRQVDGITEEFINNQAVEINHRISIQGGDCQGIEFPGGALIYELTGIICHFGADRLGHYIVYILEDDRVVMINDTIIKEAEPDSLQNIKEHCVVLLYSFCGSIGQEDLKGRDMFVKTGYLNENDFIKSDISTHDSCEKEAENASENDDRTVGRRNSLRKCRSRGAGPPSLPRVWE